MQSALAVLVLRPADLSCASAAEHCGRKATPLLKIRTPSNCRCFVASRPQSYGKKRTAGRNAEKRVAYDAKRQAR